MKKFISLFLALIMCTAVLAGCSSSEDAGEDNTTAAAAEETTETSEDEEIEYGEAVSTIEWVHDGETLITDSVWDEYFSGTAEDGVTALLDAGRVSINGIAVPATEDELTDYQVNMTSALYKTDSGWGYNVHKTTSADNLSFTQARLEFVQASSTPYGYTTTISLDEDGMCVGIDIESLESMRIAYFEDHGGTVDKISRGDFELDTDRVRYDANNITVDSDNFDSEISVGDLVIYYYSSDGWHFDKAEEVVGVLVKVEDGVYSSGDGDALTEANISRFNLINCTRPTQFYTAYTRLGLEEIEIVTYMTATNNPIGFSLGDNADEGLALAIENCYAIQDGVAVSEDGSDVASGTTWATQDAFDEFNAVIEEAESVLNDNSSTLIEKDMALYQLSVAYGESGDNPSGFVGACGTAE